MARRSWDPVRGWRLRRTFKIAPGLRLNVSKSGLGLSAGVRGLRVGVGPRGPYTSIGIPGTGLYRIDYAAAGPMKEAASRKRTGKASVAAVLPAGKGPYTPWKDRPKGIVWPAIFLMLALLVATVGGDTLVMALVVGAPSLYLLVARLRNPMRRTWDALQRGKQLMHQGHYAEAAQALEGVIQDLSAAGTPPAPESGIEEAEYHAGVAYAAMGDHINALRHLERVNPTATLASLLMYAEALIGAGRADDAIRVLQDVSGEDAENVLLITLLGKAFAAKGDHQTAIEVFKRGPLRKRQMDVGLAHLRYAYARSLEAAGATKQAVAELKKVLAFDADFADVRAARLEALERHDG
jgi:hypothetical protein